MIQPRELRVLELLADGLNNEQIARKLSISIHTVKSHKAHMYERMGARSAAHAVAMGYQMGYLKTGEWNHQ